MVLLQDPCYEIKKRRLNKAVLSVYTQTLVDNKYTPCILFSGNQATVPCKVNEMSKQSRYTPNSDGRKEHDGFIVSSHSPKKCFYCVAVKIDGQQVSIRDTKDDGDTTLSFDSNEWDAFIKGVKSGEFDI